MRRRGVWQRVLDFLTFPLRAVTLFYVDRWRLSSLASERYDYVSREVIGYCLDVGCGRNNRFVVEYLGGNGKGIDVYPYEGLTEEHIVKDITRFPFGEGTFDSVTFIANLNHIPRSSRDIELSEGSRVLRRGGNIIVTMATPAAEILAHWAIELHDRVFKTGHNVDAERGMGGEEDYYVTEGEIRERLGKAGFGEIRKKYFWTQWGLNRLFVGWKC